MPDSFLNFPIQTAKWRIRLLRLAFPHRWWVQIGPKVYILREPTDARDA